MERFEEVFFWVLYVTTALFAHEKLTYEFSVPKYAILSLGFSILLTISIIKILKKKTFALKINTAHLLFLGFALSSLLSTINVLRDRPFYFIYTIDIALYTLLNLFVAVYITNKFNEKDKVTRFLFVVILTAGLIAYDALLNFYTGYEIFLGKVGTPFTRGAIKATIGNTIFVANYLGMVIPTTLYFILSYNFGWRDLKEYFKVVIIKSLSTLSLVLMIITVIVSQTRSEYGGVFLTNLFFFIFYFLYVQRKTKKDSAREELEKTSPQLAKRLSKLQKTLIIFAAIAVVFVIVLYNLPNPLTGHGKFTAAKRVEAMFSASSWDERVLAWLSSYEQWKTHKLFGTGIGTYQILTISYMGDIIKNHPRFIWGWNNFKRTHNDYFQVLGETGIVGLFFIIALLIYLVIYFFKTIRKISDRDDALLFLALSMGFADFAIQSFFSFPGHLLPNALTAIFLASVAVSDIFNKDNWMSLKLKFGRKSLTLVMIVVLILTYSSTYMRWRYFVSEVHFKAGNSAYMALIELRKASKRLEYETSILEKDLKDLRARREKFSYLKDLQSFLNAKAKDLGSKAFNLSKFELERMRLEEIRKIEQDISTRLEKARRLLADISSKTNYYYGKALKELSSCLNINHAYGKAYFYMAALAVQPERFEYLLKSIKTLEDYEKLAQQKFDIFQKFIHPQKHRTDLKPIVDLMKKDGIETVENALGKENIIVYQSLLDAVSLYETSLLVFNERNTYKALAGRFAGLDSYIKLFRNKLPGLKNSVKATVALKKASEEYYDSFVHYAKLTIHNLPGSWNRFPDWKHYDIRRAVSGEDIYRYFADIAIRIKSIISEDNFYFLHWLADREIWAAEMMSKRGVWGVPDMVMDYLHVMANAYFFNKDYNIAEGEYLRILEMYKNSYTRIKNEIEKWEKRAKRDIRKMAEKISSEVYDGKNSLTISVNLEKVLREFSKEDIWISIQAKEIKEFMKKNTRYKVNLWDNYVKQLADYLSTNLGGDKNKIYSLLKPTASILIYERYVRFLAHYKLVLNDASELYKVISEIKETKPEEFVKGMGVKSMEKAEEIFSNFKSRLDEFKEFISKP